MVLYTNLIGIFRTNMSDYSKFTRGFLVAFVAFKLFWCRGGNQVLGALYSGTVCGSIFNGHNKACNSPVDV